MAATGQLLASAIIAGVILGGFYATVAVGLTIAFGMLDIPNIAHTAFMVVGAYLAYLAWGVFGLDPLFAIPIFAPLGFLFGLAFYRGYHVLFEHRSGQAIEGLGFFFGCLFIIEVALVLIFGVTYRVVDAPYIGPTLGSGIALVPWRMLVPFLVGVVMLGLIYLYLTRTFTGRTILAVSQDIEAVRLVGADPIRTKAVAFGIATASAVVAGVLLIIIQPVEPSVDRNLIGQAFAICILGGVTSLPGTLLAALILGVAETSTATFFGASWSPAVAFGILAITLAVRPSGIFGR